MKKGVWMLATLTSLFLTGFVSAQFFDDYYGGYGGTISISNFFDSLDPSTVTYGLLFFIFFTVIFLILTKINLFRGKRNYYGEEAPNTTAAGVVAFAISGLVVYYMYRAGYNLESFFYEMGFSGDVFSFLMLVVFVLMAFFLIKRYGTAGLFITLGLSVMFIAVFTEIIYERTMAFIIGAASFVIGIFMTKNAREWWRRNIKTY